MQRHFFVWPLLVAIVLCVFVMQAQHVTHLEEMKTSPRSANEARGREGGEKLDMDRHAKSTKDSKDQHVTHQEEMKTPPMSANEAQPSPGLEGGAKHDRHAKSTKDSKDQHVTHQEEMKTPQRSANEAQPSPGLEGGAKHDMDRHAKSTKDSKDQHVTHQEEMKTPPRSANEAQPSPGLEGGAKHDMDRHAKSTKDGDNRAQQSQLTMLNSGKQKESTVKPADQGASVPLETSSSSAQTGPGLKKDVLQPPRKDKLEHHLVVFVSSGCSGSTAVWQITKELLSAHGVNVMQGVAEGMKESKNKFWSKDKDAYQNIMDQYAAAKRNNEVWFTKVDSDPNGSLAHAKKIQALRELQPPVFISYRRDFMAKTICSIRDCFGDWGDIGYPVHPDTGKKWDLCFDRRKVAEGEGTSMVYINVKRAVKMLKTAATRTSQLLDKMQELVMRAFGKKAPVIASEELLGSGWDASALPRSVAASKQVLRIFGVEPEHAKIVKVLKRNAGKRAIESNQQKVYNYKEIAQSYGEDF